MSDAPEVDTVKVTEVAPIEGAKKRGFGPPGSTQGVCITCGKPARNSRAFYCDEHQGDKKGKSGSKKRTTQDGTKGPTTVKPVKPTNVGKDGPDKASAERNARRAKYETMLRDDANPALVEYFAKACKPADADLVKNQFGNLIALGDTQIKLAARAAVAFEDTPLGQMAKGMEDSPMVQYGTIALAAVAIGIHAFSLVKMRDQIVQAATEQMRHSQEQTGESGEVPTEPTPEPGTDPVMDRMDGSAA